MSRVVAWLDDMLKTLSVSRSNYWLSYALDVVVPLLLVFAGSRHASTFASAAASVAAGIFAFTLIEYAVHRWLFHWNVTFMVRIHAVHHRTPNELAALPFFSAPGALFLLWLLFTALLGEPIGSYFVAGIAAGYVWYAVLHHLEHSEWIHRPALRWLRKRYGMHVVHHRHDDRNFGVTTSFWDHVFGTYYLTSKVRSQVEPVAE
ncbi:sterol desaturase family protein [Steroidobacter sp.]|uniref:sterol desaturase family protein n=1 Tax=Steroidobacter sp. TaxID=1978227 RepID=UPI001A4E7091|nr:sterol desaturase family protein [Steroidobacter sp.]MBL8266136.1 sterol desaturase family protein [Steroidobacter sp.]